MVTRIVRKLVGLGLPLQLFSVTAIAALALWLVAEEGSTFIDLWLTPDQQGRLAYERNQLQAAAELFEDPAWLGAAQHRVGRYAEAAENFGRLSSATGFFNRGVSLMRAFEYRPAITAFEQAVAQAPDWVEAQDNLTLARYTLDYLERAREQSDTGEEAGIGADDVVFDNESERGAETEISRESFIEAQSAEKWMRSVDTETADFLRSRFLLEAARRGLR